MFRRQLEKKSDPRRFGLQDFAPIVKDAVERQAERQDRIEKAKKKLYRWRMAASVVSSPMYMLLGAMAGMSSMAVGGPHLFGSLGWAQALALELGLRGASVAGVMGLTWVPCRDKVTRYTWELDADFVGMGADAHDDVRKQVLEWLRALDGPATDAAKDLDEGGIDARRQAAEDLLEALPGAFRLEGRLVVTETERAAFERAQAILILLAGPIVNWICKPYGQLEDYASASLTHSADEKTAAVRTFQSQSEANKFLRQLRMFGSDEEHLNELDTAAQNMNLTSAVESTQMNVATFLRNNGNTTRTLVLSFFGRLLGDDFWQTSAVSGILTDNLASKRALEEFVVGLQKAAKLSVTADELRQFIRVVDRNDAPRLPLHEELIAAEGLQLQRPDKTLTKPLTFHSRASGADAPKPRRGWVMTVLSENPDDRKALLRALADDQLVAGGTLRFRGVDPHTIERGRIAMCPSDPQVVAIRRFIQTRGLTAADLKGPFSYFWLPSDLHKELARPNCYDNSPVASAADLQRVGICLTTTFRPGADLYLFEEPFAVQSPLVNLMLPGQLRDFADQFKVPVAITDGVDFAQPITDVLLTLNEETGVGVCGDVADVALATALTSSRYLGHFRPKDQLAHQFVRKMPDDTLLCTVRGDALTKYGTRERLPEEGYPAEVIERIMRGGLREGLQAVREGQITYTPSDALKVRMDRNGFKFSYDAAMAMAFLNADRSGTKQMAGSLETPPMANRPDLGRQLELD